MSVNKYEIIALDSGGVTVDGNGNIIPIKDNGRTLETYGDIDISINYQIDDILDITKRNTAWTKTITLPGTPDNNKFFKHIYDVNIDNVTFNPAKRIPVLIRIGTNDVLKGFMQLMNVVIENKQIDYEVSIAGSFRNIISSVGDYGLAQIDLKEYNHTRTKQSIVDSWDYNVFFNEVLTSFNEPGKGYVYPYIVNGNSQDIWDKVYVYDLFPAIYVKTVIDKIFEFAGYSYTSEFFNSDYFKKLILPFAGDRLQLTAEEVNQRKVAVGVTPNYQTSYREFVPYRQNGTSWWYNSQGGGGGSATNHPYFFPLTRESGTVTDNNSDLIFRDDENQFTLSQFTCANNGYYNIEVYANLVAEYLQANDNDIGYDGGQFEWRYKLELVRVNGSVITLDSSIDLSDPNDIYGVMFFSPSTTSDQPSPWIDEDTDLTIDMSASNVFMEAGDKVRVLVGFRHPSALNWDGLDSNMYARLLLKPFRDGTFTKFKVEAASTDSIGDDFINMNQILNQNIKMKDFLLDIVKMFNLVIQDDPNKIDNVIVEPRDQFFKSRQRVLDWDAEKKLDNNSDIKITPMSELDAKTYRFTYQQDDDFYNKEYFSETKRVYGDLDIDILNDFSDKINKMEIKFAGTPNSQQFIDGRVAPFFVEYDGEQFKSKKIKQRILFYGGKLPCNQLLLKDYPNQVASQTLTLTEYPYCGMWDHPTNPQWDLAFGRTDKIYWNSNDIYPNQNLYEKFHKQTIQNIIDVNSKLLECSVYLTPKDVSDFDFRDIIFLLGSYWRVNKIKDYNPVQSDRLTKVVLYKIIDLDIISRYQVEVPVSNKSCPVDLKSKRTKLGVVAFSPSGQEVTEDCCKQLGGTFTNGACYLKFITPTPIGSLDALITKRSTVNITGGLTTVPTSNPDGPIVLKRFNTARNTIGVQTYGYNNYVAPGSANGVIYGSNSTIAPNLQGTIVFGDNISATQSGTIYLGGIKIDQTGNITRTGINIIDGGEDEVFEPTKTNMIDIVDGTIDSVRNPGGDSKSRVIIDNSDIEGPE
jgi:hypothetical protein